MVRTIWMGALALCVYMGSTAFGAIQNGEKVTISRQSGVTFGSGPGGEFLITEESAFVGPGEIQEIYKTFCLEKTETITLSGSYWVTLDDTAYFGSGGGGYPGGDPLGDPARWLYYWYITGELDDLVPSLGFTYNNTASADALQAAFWLLEGDTASTNTLVSALVSRATTQGAWNSSLGEVLVLNLWNHPTSREQANANQSQLYFRARSGGLEQVPEPLSIAVWGTLAGIGAVVSWRRRKAA